MWDLLQKCWGVLFDVIGMYNELYPVSTSFYYFIEPQGGGAPGEGTLPEGVGAPGSKENPMIMQPILYTSASSDLLTLQVEYHDGFVEAVFAIDLEDALIKYRTMNTKNMISAHILKQDGTIVRAI